MGTVTLIRVQPDVFDRELRIKVTVPICFLEAHFLFQLGQAFLE